MPVQGVLESRWLRAKTARAVREDNSGTERSRVDQSFLKHLWALHPLRLSIRDCNNDISWRHWFARSRCLNRRLCCESCCIRPVYSCICWSAWNPIGHSVPVSLSICGRKFCWCSCLTASKPSVTLEVPGNTQGSWQYQRYLTMCMISDKTQHI